MRSRTRQKTHGILTSQNSWNGSVCTGRSALRNRKFQNANNHHHVQAGHQTHHGGVRQNSLFSWVARERVLGQKGKNDNNKFTLQMASGNCWHERESLLLPMSTCVLIPFVVCIAVVFFYRVQATEKWLQLFGFSGSFASR